MCLEVVWGLETLSDESMVINFAIDSKGNALIVVGEWLSSRVDTNNRQTFVGKHYEGSELPRQNVELRAHTCVVGYIASRPIWTTMPTLLHHLQGCRLKNLCVGHMVASNDSTHCVDVAV